MPDRKVGRLAVTPNTVLESFAPKLGLKGHRLVKAASLALEGVVGGWWRIAVADEDGVTEEKIESVRRKGGGSIEVTTMALDNPDRIPTRLVAVTSPDDSAEQE